MRKFVRIAVKIALWLWILVLVASGTAVILLLCSPESLGPLLRLLILAAGIFVLGYLLLSLFWKQ